MFTSFVLFSGYDSRPQETACFTDCVLLWGFPCFSWDILANEEHCWRQSFWESLLVLSSLYAFLLGELFILLLHLLISTQNVENYLMLDHILKLSFSTDCDSSSFKNGSMVLCALQSYVVLLLDHKTSHANTSFSEEFIIKKGILEDIWTHAILSWNSCTLLGSNITTCSL